MERIKKDLWFALISFITAVVLGIMFAINANLACACVFCFLAGADFMVLLIDIVDLINAKLDNKHDDN